MSGLLAVLGPGFAAALLVLLAKAGALFLVGEAATRLLGRAAAASRHLVSFVGLRGCSCFRC